MTTVLVGPNPERSPSIRVALPMGFESLVNVWNSLLGKLLPPRALITALETCKIPSGLLHRVVPYSNCVCSLLLVDCFASVFFLETAWQRQEAGLAAFLRSCSAWTPHVPVGVPLLFGCVIFRFVDDANLFLLLMPPSKSTASQATEPRHRHPPSP